jgi:endonuclease YncB( thermonuclease family)
MANFNVNRLSAVILYALLLGIAGHAAAKVFKWQDPQGETHYSDRAQNNARTVDIDPGFSFAAVKKVYDGDTVLLQDGRKVRLLGINTPEVAHRDKDAEAGGETAKAWLENALRGKKVRLQADTEKQDKYGRVLAYLFTEDGMHVNVELVKHGLAAVTVHPPNLLYVGPLLAAQREAEALKLGIWSVPAYAAKPAETLNRDNSRGWQRVTGRVNNIRRKGKYTYLEFSPQFNARIAPDDLPLFGDVDEYAGKEVELRGWLSRSKDRYSLLLRHPSAIEIVR